MPWGILFWKDPHGRQSSFIKWWKDGEEWCLAATVPDSMSVAIVTTTAQLAMAPASGVLGAVVGWLAVIDTRWATTNICYPEPLISILLFMLFRSVQEKVHQLPRGLKRGNSLCTVAALSRVRILWSCVLMKLYPRSWTHWSGSCWRPASLRDFLPRQETKILLERR